MKFLTSAGTVAGLTALAVIFALSFREFIGLMPAHRLIRKLAKPFARAIAVVVGLSPTVLVLWEKSWLSDEAALDVIPEWGVRALAVLFLMAAPALAGCCLAVPPAARQPISRMRAVFASILLFWIDLAVLWWRSNLF